MGVVIVRTLILYIAVIIGLRLMGKRQVGDMQPSELVITILISEVAAVPMQSNDIPMIYGILSIATLVTTEIALSMVSLKSQSAREVLSGHPCVVMKDGQFLQGELSRMRITIDDIYEELRLQRVTRLSDISYAVLETNGKLSVLLKPQAETPTRDDMNVQSSDPGPIHLLVRDGVLDRRVMKDCDISDTAFQNMLDSKNLALSEVFFCTVDDSGRLWEIEGRQAK